MADTFTLNTGDPKFSPTEPLSVNGYSFVPTAERDAALAHAERLARALDKAEEALVHLDEGALGFVEVPTGEDRDGCFIYPLRDELLGHIRAALASWQERAA